MFVHILRTHYPHWGLYSGINRFLEYIDTETFSVEVQLVADGDDDFPVGNQIVRKALRGAIQSQGMHWYKLSDLMAEIKAFGRCRHGKVDIVHYLDGEHSAQYLPLLANRLGKNRPKIISSYHQPPEMLDKLVRRNVVARLDGLTVVAPEQVEYFSEFIEPEKIHMVLHGIDVDFFRPRETPKKDGQFRCVTVGHYLRDFNALNAVARRLIDCKEIEFHVVSSWADGLDHLPNVKLYQGISDLELLRLYQESDLMFFPLVNSTANNSLLEGIACGLPVLSTALPSVKTYLPGQEALLIKNNDPDQLTDAILYLTDNPEALRSMGIKARRRAEELDWRNIAPQYEAVYSRLPGNVDS